VLVIGRLADGVEEAIARRGSGLTVIRMPAEENSLRGMMAAITARADGGRR
jgi:hypothetical protein